jgi:hypothetical protein
MEKRFFLVAAARKGAKLDCADTCLARQDLMLQDRMLQDRMLQDLVLQSPGVVTPDVPRP